jgi:hypothetical protein
MTFKFHKKLRMPKQSEPQRIAPQPDPSIDVKLYSSKAQGWKFLAKKLITQFFEEIDDFLIYNEEYGENPLEVVSYKKEEYETDDYWIIVHPSATEIIESMDNLYKLGIYSIRDIVKVPNELVKVPQYWKIKY